MSKKEKTEIRDVANQKGSVRWREEFVRWGKGSPRWREEFVRWGKGSPRWREEFGRWGKGSPRWREEFVRWGKGSARWREEFVRWGKGSPRWRKEFVRWGKGSPRWGKGSPRWWTCSGMMVIILFISRWILGTGQLPEQIFFIFSCEIYRIKCILCKMMSTFENWRSKPEMNLSSEERGN